MEAVLASLVIAGLSVVGILFFKNRSVRESDSSPFLPLSVGAFLAVTFFELLPEAFHETEGASIAIAVGFLGFFLLSRILREYHHHHRIGDDTAHDDAHHHERGSLVLMGDAVHNFADGIVIATAFSISIELGIATTIGIALHEVPQEIAEFYILLRAGYSRSKALLLNFLSALMVVVGVVLTNVFIGHFEAWVGILIGIAAGNLLYIAASDLLPSLTSTKVTRTEFMRQSSLVVVGLVAIAALLAYAHGEHGHGHEEHDAHIESEHTKEHH
jgi:zinc and cadmium transporter